ncbi:MAG: PD-(D/E)XK nuclease family protein [Firmicutes bacterium]|nr:PD-(D/E)XK nuclease family protein [Bacillota bacterium]
MNLYYADALTDKEQFIFDHIDPKRKTILIVPDQFSLQAEQDALRICGRRALMDLMITDFNALGHKIVHERDGHDPQIIDKYGRHMLLAVLIERMNEELTILRCRRGPGPLAEQMNAMISQLKRYEIDPDLLEQSLEQLKQETDLSRSGGNYLIAKLEDVLRIYRAYEASIEGIYQDSEDYITYYADRMPDSAIIRGADVWIYGFDSFTPKNLLVIRKLLEAAAQVSVVLTYAAGAAEQREEAAVRSLTQGGGGTLFDLTEQVMDRLQALAGECGVQVSRQQITGYTRRCIWNAAAEHGSESGAEHGSEPGAEHAAGPGGLGEHIRLVQTSGSYEEAESAAAFIQELVRDRGYQYGEIAVLCNDMDGRGRMLRRAFERWDIPAFADQKRKVLHQPVVSFLLSFLEVLTAGLRGDGIIGMIKSGLLGWEPEEEFLLENYLTEFRIRGSRWQQEFVWDGDRYTKEEMERLNEMRAFLVSVCERAKDSIGRRNTAREKVAGLIDYLENEFRIGERIDTALERQQKLGLMEGAAETAQIWNAICAILDQIVQVIGEERISNRLLQDMIREGLQSLEIGLVPVSRDHVIIGTLQRSRPGRIRALIVTGANAGLLPLDAPDEGILSRREKERLQAMDLEFAGREQVAQMEEQLAIYRMFSLPEEMLYVSCSDTGDDGSMLRPSDIFRKLQAWQPQIEGDLNDRPFEQRIGSRRATIPYLAEAMRREQAGDPPELGWEHVRQWYAGNDPKSTQSLIAGARFSNRREALGEQLADALYRGDREEIEASASRLEKFSGCPFAHFVQYGLRAQEQRLFEVGGREIGDVYHQCMMEFSRDVEERNLWQEITAEECEALVRRILQRNAKQYRQGLFASDDSGAFRMERIAQICGDIAWAMVMQVRRGRIRRMYFEEPFGRSGRIPPMEVDVAGRKVLIRGVIDRIDQVATGDDKPDGIRIIDYKTGNPILRAEDFASGYRLQLMVYMDAALRSGLEEVQPAGVFYFKIREFDFDGDGTGGIPDPRDAEDLDLRMRRFYRMEGIAVNDAALLGAMDQSLETKAKVESNIIPVKYDPKKEGFQKLSGGTLMEGEAFRQLMEQTEHQVEKICEGICRGEISPIPKREKNKDRDGNRISACRYCGFQSICGFDPSIRGCRYEDV